MVVYTIIHFIITFPYITNTLDIDQVPNSITKFIQQANLPAQQTLSAWHERAETRQHRVDSISHKLFPLFVDLTFIL